MPQQQPNCRRPDLLPAPRFGQRGLAITGFIVWVDENNNLDGNGARILTDATDGNAAVDAGELVLMQSVAPVGTLQISANCGHVSFAPTGFTRQAGGLCFPLPVRSILLCATAAVA